MSASPRFELVILRGRIPFSYDYDGLSASVAALPRDDRSLTLTEDDVEAYEVCAYPCQEIRLRLTEGAVERRARAEIAPQSPFFVALDGAVLYAGREYLRYGAAALRFPVLHDDAPDRRVLSLRSALWGGGGADAERIDRPELRALFSARGALRER